MSIGSARRPFAVVTSVRLPNVAPPLGFSETLRSCAELVCAAVALVFGSIALVHMLDLALDHVHAWIG